MEGVFCCKLTFPHPHSGWFYVSHALRTQLTKVNNNITQPIGKYYFGCVAIINQIKNNRSYK